MPISEAHKKALRKFKEKVYDRHEVTMPKGKKEIVKAHSEAHGKSVNAFINRAITEQMEQVNETR